MESSTATRVGRSQLRSCGGGVEESMGVWVRVGYLWCTRGSLLSRCARRWAGCQAAKSGSKWIQAPRAGRRANMSGITCSDSLTQAPAVHRAASSLRSPRIPGGTPPGACLETCIHSFPWSQPLFPNSATTAHLMSRSSADARAGSAAPQLHSNTGL